MVITQKFSNIVEVTKMALLDKKWSLWGHQSSVTIGIKQMAPDS